MDYLQECNPKEFLNKSIMLGVPLVALGTGLSFLQPREIWEFSQRSMTIAYPIMASGLSVLTFAAFYQVADIWKWKIPHLALIGINPLVIYILQQVLIAFYGDVLPNAAPWWQALLGFIIIYGICYLIARYLYRNKYIIKL